MNEATAGFIRAHADDDVRQLALKGVKNPEIDLPFALDQIAGRQTARRKLPTWAASDGIVFPPHLSMEQCSSELTARYKRTLEEGGGRKAKGGSRMVDLTGGFGVDFSFMAPAFDEAVYVERQPLLCDIARRNFQLLGLHQAEVVCGDTEDYLRQMPRANLIYIDPARRDRQGQRTYDISDCTPDVVALRDQLLKKADRVLIKLSPMLDWRKAVQNLGADGVSEVHIVSVQNECKELLVVLEEGGEKREEREVLVRCVNIHSDGTLQVFEAHEQPATNVSLSTSDISLTSLLSPLSSYYIYEPNASIMKAGCFAEVADAFGVSQLASNSHLFSSERLVDGFPGRSFVIDNITTMNKRELRTALTGLTQANITVRNFPLNVAQLRQRLKLSEGGSTYIFATTLADKRHVLLICRKTQTSVSH